MLTVDDYAKYRTAHRDGMTIRQIARSFHVSRRKVRDALTAPEPKPYTRTKPPPTPVLGPFQAVIDQVLSDDRDAPPKQRHTAAQLFRRLQDEHHHSDSYLTVRRYVAAYRLNYSRTLVSSSLIIYKLRKKPIRPRCGRWDASRFHSGRPGTR